MLSVFSASFAGHRMVLALVVGCGAGGVVVAHERGGPHREWREWRAEVLSGKFERWFRPGELGHEPGSPAPEPGPRAYLTRSIGTGGTAEGREWERRNGLGARLQFSHNLSRVFPRALFDEHPEFFPMIEGRRWRPPEKGPATWNPDLGEPAVVEHAAKVASEFFAANPDAVSFALGTNDGMRFGDSPATARWTVPPRFFRDRPDYSDLVFQFMNAVAERTAAEWPDKYLGALAYYWSEQTPSFPVHPKVLPFLTADRAQGYDRTFRREEDALQKRWAAAGPERLGIYDYLYGYGFLVPRIHTALLARHLREARRAGFTDYYAEAYPHWGLDGPQPWLVARLLEDPEQDHRRLLREYYRRYFRAAAGPMRRFFELCEERWMTQEGPSYWLKHYRSDTQAALYPPETRASLRALLDEAGRRAEGDETVAARVALVSAAFGVSERFVEMVERREALGRAVLGGAAREAVAALREADAAARAAFVAELETVKAGWPLGLGRVHLADVLRNDWRPTADWWLAGGVREGARELMPDGAWRGAARPELRIGDLLFSAALPAAWESRVEPWRGIRAELVDRADGRRVLRLENNKHSEFRTAVFLPDGEGEWVASMQVRGQCGPLARLFLRTAWMSADKRVLGEERAVALPAGDWRNGVRLPLPLGPRPEGAAAVIYIFTVLDQQAGDWLEVERVSVM
jgi:hypothetical protein